MSTSCPIPLVCVVLVWLTSFAFLSAPAATRGSDAALGCRASAQQVGKYQRVDFELAVPWTYRNPFDPHEVEVTLEIRTPGGATQSLPAFWMQAYQ